MSVSPDNLTILIVDPLPLRTLGLVSVLDRLTEGKKFRVASLAPEDAERFIASETPCSMIIYNIGGGSLADHKHARRIKSLRGHAAGTPLVIFSDSDTREEVVSAYTAGAQGFLYAGTDPHLALQALSFIFKGGSYFPAAVAAKHRRPGQADAATRSRRRHSNGACTRRRAVRTALPPRQRQTSLPSGKSRYSNCWAMAN